MPTKEGQPIETIGKLKLPPRLYFEPEILLSVLSPVIPDLYELNQRIEEKYNLLIKDLGLQIDRNHQQPLFLAADDHDLIGIYFAEIGRYPLLTSPQEQILARMIAEGKTAILHLKEPKSQPKLNDSIEAILNGAAARNLFTKCNLRLVFTPAREFINRGFPFIELIQEGNIGLIRAVEKYDETKGYKFSTYADWWIMAEIRRAIDNQARTIRTPVYMLSLTRHFRKTFRQLEQNLGREPTQEEIAKTMGVSVSKIGKIVAVPQKPLSFETLSLERFSLEEPSSMEEKVAQKDEGARLREIVASLPERQKRVLEMQFELGDNLPLTIREIGSTLGVTHQRVNTIKKQALRALKRLFLP